MKVNAFYPLFGLAALAVWMKPDAPETPVAWAAPLAPSAKLDVAHANEVPEGMASL